MRVCGVKETSFAVWLQGGSPSRVFFRCGYQRYVVTREEAIMLARWLVAAVDAQDEGRWFDETYTPPKPPADGEMGGDAR